MVGRRLEFPAPPTMVLPDDTAIAWRVQHIAAGTRVRVLIGVCYIRSVGPRRVRYAEGCTGGMERHSQRRAGWFLTESDAQAYGVELAGYLVRKLNRSIEALQAQVIAWAP